MGLLQWIVGGLVVLVLIRVIWRSGYNKGRADAAVDGIETCQLAMRATQELLDTAKSWLTAEQTVEQLRQELAYALNVGGLVGLPEGFPPRADV